MKRENSERSASEDRVDKGGGEPTNERSMDRKVYDLSTPLWSKYYQKVRKRIRFPRYYKRALNW
jgi:hypothetical protein